MTNVQSHTTEKAPTLEEYAPISAQLVAELYSNCVMFSKAEAYYRVHALNSNLGPCPPGALIRYVLIKGARVNNEDLHRFAKGLYDQQNSNVLLWVPSRPTRPPLDVGSDMGYKEY